MRVATTLFGESGVVLRDRNLQLLMIATVPSVLGTTLISPILDSLTDPFGVSLAEIGLMVTVFSAPAIVLIPIIGMLTDRIGRKPVLITSLVVFGLGGIGIVFTTDFRLVLVLRFIQGLGGAGMGPVIVTSFGDLYEDTKEATAQGLRLGFGGSSNLTFPIIAGTIVTLGWQFPFLLYGIAIPIAVLVYIWFDEPTTNDANPNDYNESNRGGSQRTTYLRELGRLASKPRVFSVLIARSLPTLIFTGFLTYNSAVVVQLLDGTPSEAGILVAVVSFIYAISGTQSGRITAIFSRRVYPLIAAHLVMGTGMVIIATAPSLLIAAVGAAGIGSGFGFSIALYRSILTGFAPEDLRGGLVSAGEASSRIASTLIPVIMGASIGILSGIVGLQQAITITVAGVGIGTALIGLVCSAVLLLGPAVKNTPTD